MNPKIRVPNIAAPGDIPEFSAPELSAIRPAAFAPMDILRRAGVSPHPEGGFVDATGNRLSLGEVLGRAGPPPENAVIQEALAAARGQGRVREGSLAGLLGAVGFEPVKGEGGSVVGLQAVGPTAGLRMGVEEASLGALLKAVKGEAELPPHLVRLKQEQELALHGELRNQLGPGFSTSTPGIQAISDFRQRWAEISDAVRRGDIDTFQAVSLGRQAGNESLARTLGDLVGFSTAGAAPFSPVISAIQQGRAFDLSSGETLANLAQQANLTNAQFGMNRNLFNANLGFERARTLADLGLQRNIGLAGLRSQANIASTQARAQTLGSIFGGLGQVGGGALGIWALGGFGKK